MKYETLEPVRPAPLEPLPGTDSLFKFDNGTIVRLRMTAKTSAGDVRDSSPEPGAGETVYLKLRCSLCKDESGDVREGVDGNHLVLAAEVHGITAEALLTGQSFEAWEADRVDDILQKAVRKAHLLDQVFAKHRLVAEA